MAATARLVEQRDVAERLKAIAGNRVDAGDAAQLELLQADTESRRVDALVQQSKLREDQAVQALQSNYPGLPPLLATVLPVPPAPLDMGSADFGDGLPSSMRSTLQRQAEFKPLSYEPHELRCANLLASPRFTYLPGLAVCRQNGSGRWVITTRSKQCTQ
jgi:hypothetical protein